MSSILIYAEYFVWQFTVMGQYLPQKLIDHSTETVANHCHKPNHHEDINYHRTFIVHTIIIICMSNTINCNRLIITWYFQTIGAVDLYVIEFIYSWNLVHTDIKAT